MHVKIVSSAALIFSLVMGIGTALAMEGGCPMMQHGGGGGEKTGHYFHHLLKHQKEIGLSPDQVAKIKAMHLDLAKLEAKSKADIDVVELDLHTLTDDLKAELSAIEAKIAESEKLKTALRMSAIKAKREAMGLLTAEQLEKERGAHEKMMQQKQGDGGHGEGGGGGHQH